MDALRGIAALIVLIMHLVGFRGGHLAVDFFFMLSGFVMARTYEGRLRKGELSPLRFFIKRFARLWPTMAVGATLGLIAALLHGGGTELLSVFFFALLLIPGGAVSPYALNLPAWSIFYELLANALHGALFAKLNRLWPIFAAVSLGLVLSFSYGGFPRILGETTLVMQGLVVFRALAAYILGVMLYRVFGDTPPVRIPFAFGVVALPTYVAFVSTYTFPFWPLPFIFVIAPMLIFAGLDKAPPISSTILGEVSFPLYAVHMPIIYLLGGSIWAFFASIAVASLWLVGPVLKQPERFGLAANAVATRSD